MKKFILTVIAAGMVIGSSSFAQETPTVTINGGKIFFHDQQAIIKDDRTLVPARGVFEALGAEVTWHGEEKRVQIDSENNVTRVYLTIDSDNMEVYTFKNIFSADKVDKTLDVPAQVINDRTMIPLRAVADAFGCEVDWIQEEMNAVIKTEKGILPFGEGAENTYIYLSTDAQDVTAGDSFDIFVNIKNFPKGCVITDGALGLIFDKENFKYDSCTLYKDEADIDAIIATNRNIAPDTIFTEFVCTSGKDLCSDGTYMKITMKALTDKGGEIKLSRNYNTDRGYNTTLTFDNTEKDYSFVYSPLDMGIDTTALVLK